MLLLEDLLVLLVKPHSLKVEQQKPDNPETMIKHSVMTILRLDMVLLLRFI